MAQLTVSIPVAAKMLDICDDTLRAKLRTGEIPGMVRIGTRLLVSVKVLTDWVEQEARRIEQEREMSKPVHMRLYPEGLKRRAK